MYCKKNIPNNPTSVKTVLQQQEFNVPERFRIGKMFSIRYRRNERGKEAFGGERRVGWFWKPYPIPVPVDLTLAYNFRCAVLLNIERIANGACRILFHWILNRRARAKREYTANGQTKWQRFWGGARGNGKNGGRVCTIESRAIRVAVQYIYIENVAPLFKDPRLAITISR